MTKQELLQLPEVKEIALEFAQKHIQEIGAKTSGMEKLFGEFLKEQTPTPEWKILSFVSKEHQTIFSLKENGTYGPFSSTKEEFLKFPNLFPIYSVKRKDGEVFTVGDKVIDSLGVEFIIAKFDPGTTSSRMMVLKTTKDWSWLNLINKAPKCTPLFTSVDGVDIYEGDQWWWVDKTEALTPGWYAYLTNLFLKGNISEYFSTEAAAKEWIVMNKPCLSIQEIIDSLFNPTMLSMESLKKLVKSKP